MRASIPALLFVLALAACAQPRPEVRSAAWENNAALLTTPAANQ